MLTHLHVKNLALIREAEIDFTEGLNILTGETGAGKSIVIGSVSLALGGKVSREMVRPGADYGLAELVFLVNREKQKEKLLELGITPEEDQVIISRKISDGRSINKINGETVTLSQLRETASLLIDVHGQHEHQSLLQKKKHLEILDEFAKEELGPVKEKLAGAFQNWKKLKKQLQEAQMDEESRLREISLLEFETDEIGKAELVPGEDEELERRYRRMTNARKLMEAAGSAYALTGYEEESGAGAVIGRAVRELQSAASFDEELSGLASLLSDVDTLEEILAYQEKQEQRLAALQDYDRYLQDLEAQLKKAEEELQDLCAEASGIRQRYGKMLCEKIKEHLIDLNFLNVEFEMAFEELPEYTAQGKDSAEFLISTNPGEPLRPLMKIASGGELSRIMLAIKTVLADRDEIDTVIFDEIDVGISGRTAQKVSEKMMLIGRTRQVICITHLAQIAAMADSHYRIEKQVEEGETRTQIRRLSEKESIEELARILGGAEITDAVTKNAEEMRALALERKQSR